MGKLRRQFGFWGTLGSFRLRQLWAPEFVFGLLLGGGLAWILIAKGTAQDRADAAGDFLTLAGSLLGVVFAGFALVIAFLSDPYLKRLEETSEKTEGFLRPFMFSTGLQVGVILGAVGYRAVSSILPGDFEKAWFAVLSILFVTAILDVVALARSVMMHGVARGRGSVHS